MTNTQNKVSRIGHIICTDERFFNMDQSWRYSLIGRIEIAPTTGTPLRVFKVRVSIRRNAHDNQSYACISMWNRGKWEHVAMIPIMDCACSVVSYTDKDPDIKLFQADAAVLGAIAINIFD